MTISTFFNTSDNHNDLVYSVFTFLTPSELTNCKTVNKRFNTIADNPNLYRGIAHSVKVSLDNFKAIERGYQQNLRVIQCLETSVELKSRELKNVTKSCLGLVVHFSRSLPCVHSLLCESFPSLQREEYNQAQLKKELKKLHLEINQASALLELSKKNLKKAESKYLSSLSQYQTDIGLTKIYQLFNGKSEFEQLPQFGLSEVNWLWNAAPINHNTMTAPIVRVNKIGQIAFTIRARNKNGDLEFQTFAQEFFNRKSWYATGTNIIQISNKLIVDGKVDKKAYEDLRNYIETGHHEDYTLS